METLPKSEVGARFRKKVGSFYFQAKLGITMTVICFWLPHLPDLLRAFFRPSGRLPPQRWRANWSPARMHRARAQWNSLRAIPL